MAFPKVRDNIDRVVALLEQIARNTGGMDSPAGGDDSDSPTVPEGLRPLVPDRYLVVETADLDPEEHDVTDDGTITLVPGETATLAEWSVSRKDPVSIGLLAAGASDEQDVQYAIEIDNDRTAGGWKRSPLGLINNPFSFVDELGGIVIADHKVRYVAEYSADATGEVDLAARLHMEVL